MDDVPVSVFFDDRVDAMKSQTVVPPNGVFTWPQIVAAAVRAYQGCDLALSELDAFVDDMARHICNERRGDVRESVTRAEFAAALVKQGVAPTIYTPPERSPRCPTRFRRLQSRLRSATRSLRRSSRAR